MDRRKDCLGKGNGLSSQCNQKTRKDKAMTESFGIFLVLLAIFQLVISRVMNERVK